MAASLLKLKSSVKSNEPAPVPKSSCRYQIVFALLKVVTRIDPNGGSWFPVFRFFPHSSECRAASSWTSPVLLLWSWLGMDENHPWWTPKWLAAVHLPQNNGPMGLALIHHHISVSLRCLKGAGDHRTMDWNRVWAVFKIVWGYTNHQQPIYFGYFWIITIHEYMNSHSQPPLLQISNHRLVPRFHGQVHRCGTAPGGFGKPAAQIQMDHRLHRCAIIHDYPKPTKMGISHKNMSFLFTYLHLLTNKNMDCTRILRRTAEGFAISWWLNSNLFQLIPIFGGKIQLSTDPGWCWLRHHFGG